jgi:protocatechuate 3,4-dioxygenase beta subunit
LLAASALAATRLVLDDALAEPLAPTPQCHDGQAPTVRQSEGPYFKPSSPERADFVESNTKARLVELSGQVLTRSCRPVPRALMELWHADERGERNVRSTYKSVGKNLLLVYAVLRGRPVKRIAKER